MIHEEFGFTDLLTNTWKPKKYTGTFQVAEGIPTVSNGGLVIKADGASINGTFGVSGGVKTWTSPDGVTWTRNGDGRSSAAAKYLAVGGAGTALRTFYPDAEVVGLLSTCIMVEENLMDHHHRLL